MNFEINISDQAYRYLIVHRGSLDHLKDNRKKWERAYHDGIKDSYNSMKAHLPPACDSILDVGAGLGGVDILLHRHYQGETLVTLLDGEDDPPEMILHRKTFGNRLVALQFLRDNDVLAAYRSPKDPKALDEPADLVISTGAWCFHFPPEEYLEWVMCNTTPGATLILDVRTSNPAWHATLEANLRAGPVIFQDAKRTRRVFYDD